MDSFEINDRQEIVIVKNQTSRLSNIRNAVLADSTNNENSLA